jgi:nucleoside-diphosphate-sugar epimerase
VKYFLTGASGFIGGHVARQLAAAGHQVFAVVRQPERATDLQNAGVIAVKGDITDKASMRAAMEGADGVFHIAGWYRIGVHEKRPGQRINVDGTRDVLELMQELRIPKGVYTSTLAVYSDTHGVPVDEGYYHGGPWLSEYDRTKWAAHYEVAVPMIRQGLPLVIALPGLVYGPGDTSPMSDVFEQYLQRQLPMVPARTAFCWGHVDDTARGHVLAMEKGRPGESYNICGPTHTLVEALHIAQQVTGIPAPRLHAPPALLKTMAALEGPLEGAGVIHPPEQYSAESLRVIAGVTYLGDNAKARRELGFSVRPLEEGLRETLAYDMQRLGLRPPSERA